MRLLQVGPSTFFSAKQYEVFDIELRSVKTCRRASAPAPVLFLSGLPGSIVLGCSSGECRTGGGWGCGGWLVCVCCVP